MARGLQYETDLDDAAELGFGLSKILEEELARSW
jgi:hypothetical protein